MSGMIASIDWSAPPARGLGPISVGCGVTSATAGGYVVASTANLAASPSGKCEGVSITSTDGILPFNVLTAGRLSAGQAPGVGVGNSADFAVLNSAGLVVRSSSYVTGLTVGICAADGSVDLGLGQGPPGVQGPTKTAVTVSAATMGYAAVLSGDAVDPTKITLGTSSARVLSNVLVGIYVSAFGAGANATYADMGARVATAITGLGAGKRTFGIVSSTGQIVRKDVPDPGDMVAGMVDTNGTLQVFPIVIGSSVVNAGGQPYLPDITGITSSSAALQSAIDASLIAGGQVLTGNPDGNYIIEIPKGYFLLNAPLRIYNSRVTLRGAERGATHLSADTFIGPAIFSSPTQTAPNLAIGDFAGGNALILDHDGVNQLDRWVQISEYGAGMNFNGFGAWEVALIFKKTSNPAIANEYIIASNGQRRSTDTLALTAGDTVVSTAFAVHVGNASSGVNGGIYFTLTTTTGQTTIVSGANALTVDGNYHEVIANYDGATMRIFVDRVLVASAAKTGTIVQRTWERVGLAKGATIYFGQGQLLSSANGNLASLYFRDGQTITSSGTLTLPVAKYAYPPVDIHVTFTTNFDDWSPQIKTFDITNVTNANPMVVTTAAPHGLTANSYFIISGVGGAVNANNTWPLGYVNVLSPTTFSLPAAAGGAYTSGGKLVLGGAMLKGYSRNIAGNLGQLISYYPVIHDADFRQLVERINIEKMHISAQWGEAIFATKTIASAYRDLFIVGKNGITLFDNCYESVLFNCSFQGSGAIADHRTGVYFGSACYMSLMQRCDITSFEFGAVVLSDVTFFGPLYFVVNRHQLIVMNVNLFTWIGMSTINDEAGTAGVGEDQIMVIATQQAVFEGLQMSISLTTNHNIAVDQVGLNGVTKVSIRDSFLGVASGAAGHILETSGKILPLVGTIGLDMVIQETPSHGPLIDPASTGGNTCPIIVHPLAEAAEAIFGVALPDANSTLTRDQHLHGAIKFTGALTLPRTVTIPNVPLGRKWFFNGTTGGLALTLVASGGATNITVAAGVGHMVGFDGTDLYLIA